MFLILIWVYQLAKQIWLNASAFSKKEDQGEESKIILSNMYMWLERLITKFPTSFLVLKLHSFDMSLVMLKERKQLNMDNYVQNSNANICFHPLLNFFQAIPQTQGYYYEVAYHKLSSSRKTKWLKRHYLHRGCQNSSRSCHVWTMKEDADGTLHIFTTLLSVNENTWTNQTNDKPGTVIHTVRDNNVQNL